VPAFRIIVPLDLNNDGTDDVTFDNFAGNSEFLLLPAASNRVVVTTTNATVEPLALGTTISLNLAVGLDWFQGQRTVTRCVSFPPPTGLVCSGNFFGQDAYMGLEFQIGQDTHYGWVRFDHVESSGSGGHIIEWAYESQPDVEIVAGAVPEPNSIVLLFAALLSLQSFRRER
jgi:hypothetical protein